MKAQIIVSVITHSSKVAVLRRLYGFPIKKAALSSLTKRRGHVYNRASKDGSLWSVQAFPNRFRIRRKAAADLGGGYFFRSTPNLIAAITSISNAMVSAVLMRSPPFYGETTVPFLLTNSIIHGSPCFVNFPRRPLGGFCYVRASPPVLHRTHGKPCGICRRIDLRLFPVTLRPLKAWWFRQTGRF